MSLGSFLRNAIILGIYPPVQGGSSGGASVFTFASADIDATQSGPAPLFTTVNEFNWFIPTEITVIATAVAGFTSVPSLSIGSDSGGSPAYSNLLSQYELDASMATGIAQTIPLSNAPWLEAGEIGTFLQTNILVVAGASQFNLKIILKGLGVNA
jgi:hypothetical protein